VKKTFVLAVWLVVACVAGTAQAASLLFEYTGTVKTVGGTVLDGSLLGVDFAPGDTVSGCFVFESPGPPGRTPAGFYPESISAFQFWTFSAEGTQRSFSAFNIDPTLASVTAYKQVGTGSIYDNYSFWITVPGATWLTDAKPVNLLIVNELDPQQFNWTVTHFVLQRVDIASSNPLRFTEVKVSIDSVRVMPEKSRGCGGPLPPTP